MACADRPICFGTFAPRGKLISPDRTGISRQLPRNPSSSDLVRRWRQMVTDRRSVGSALLAANPIFFRQRQNVVGPRSGRDRDVPTWPRRLMTLLIRDLVAAPASAVTARSGG